MPLFALLLALVAADPSAPSEAALALRAGDLDRALVLPAADEVEGRYIRARVALARGDDRAARRELRELPEEEPRRLELAWRAAHAAGIPAAIWHSAAAWCRAGDPSGRACADEELYRDAVPPQQVELAAPAELPLVPGMPVPMLRGAIGGHETGLVLDTGASQTVVSLQLARRLGLRTTSRTFPVGVAAGGAAAQARLALLPSLAVGPALVRHLPVLVVDLPELERLGIEAIVSPQQAFAGLQVAFDFPNDRLLLAREPALPAAGRSVRLPWVQVGFDLAVEGRVGAGRTGLFSIDTGMEGGYALASRYATQKAGRGVAVVGGAGGSAALSRIEPRPVSLGGLAIEPEGACVLTPLASADAIQLAGLLGNGLWRRGVLTLDTVGRAVHLALP